jgi:hypothetical protein
MTSPLLKAESALKSLFETRLGGFSRSGLLTRLTEAVIMEIRDLTRNQTGSPRFAPDSFLLHANHATWQRVYHDSHWSEKIIDAIQKEARDSGITFQSPLRVDPKEDGRLEDGDFWVECSWQADTGHKTKAVGQPAHLQASYPSQPNSEFLIADGTEYKLQKPVINLGRRESNDLVIEDKRVSRYHAQIRCDEGITTIHDLDSTGGTFVNNIRVRTHTLKPGDVISLAGFPLIFHSDADLSRTDKIVVEHHGGGDPK